MASVSATSTSSQNLQFEDIAEQLFVHMNLTSEEMQIFDLKSRAIDGKYYRVDFQTEGNAYLASRGAGAYQPGYDPSSLAEDGFAPYTVNEMLFYPKQHYISTDFTGQMKAAVKSNKGGYFNLADFRFKDTAEQMKERVATKLAGSSAGTLARIKTTPTNTTVSINYAGYTGVSPSRSWEAGVRLLRAGLRVDAVAATRVAALRNGANDRGRQITAVGLDTGSSGTGPTITLNSTPSTWVADDYLVIYNERQQAALSSATDWNTGTAGLVGILDTVDDGTDFPYYGGLARSAYPTLQAQVFLNGGTLRPLTQQIINFAIARKKMISGGNSDFFYSTWDVQRQFVDFLTIQGSGSSGVTSNNNPIRYDNPGTNGSKVKIGFNSYEVYPLGSAGHLAFMASRHAPHHCGFIIERSTGVLLQDGPPSYIDYDGNTIRKVVGKDEATADWVWRATGFVCREPWKNIRIEDLTGDHMTI